MPFVWIAWGIAELSIGPILAYYLNSNDWRYFGLYFMFMPSLLFGICLIFLIEPARLTYLSNPLKALE
jgi:hypothetical protein